MKIFHTLLLLAFPLFLLAQNATEQETQIYQVKKGDTAFSIAQKHGLTLEQLYRANPDIVEGKVRKGDFLLIPTATQAGEMTAVEATAQPQATVHNSYAQLRVAVLLPFGEESARAAKFLEFYQGFLMAVDSLSAEGTDVTVYALNTGRTATDIRQVLDEPELESMQLIIGPADQEQVPALSDFCIAHNIKLVLPFSNLKTTMRTSSPANATVYNTTPKAATLQQHFAATLAKQAGTQNFVVLNTDKPDSKGESLVNILRTQLGNKGIAMRQLSLNGDDAAFEAALNEFRDNCILPDNVSIKTLNILTSRLKEFLETHPGYKVSLIGYPEWQTYTGSLLNDFYLFNTRFYTSYYRNPLAERTADFERRFTQNFGYGMAPTFPRYGTLGFDLGYYFMHGMATLGDNFDKRQSELRYEPYQHPFSFSTDPDNQSFLNEQVLIIHYSPEQTIDVWK